MEYDINFDNEVINASCILHNITEDFKDHIPESPTCTSFIEQSQRFFPQPNSGSHESSDSEGKRVRNALSDFLFDQ